MENKNGKIKRKTKSLEVTAWIVNETSEMLMRWNLMGLLKWDGI